MTNITEQKKPMDFSVFRRTVNEKRRMRAPINESAYNRYGRHRGTPVSNEFTLEEIQMMIRTGDLETLRMLSYYYYRTNSYYRNRIEFLVNLPLYDTMVVPLLGEGTAQNLSIKVFINACKFIDKLNVPVNFARITRQWLLTGIYNGILREYEDKVIIQDLPLAYCRTRFKDFYGFNILEFNIMYFTTFSDKDTRIEALLTFPQCIQRAWRQWEANKTSLDPWVPIPFEEGGICFCFSDDQTPFLIPSLIQLKKMDDAVTREEKRDENELYKILIQQMPVDSNGHLVFQLEEVAEMHAAVADMLSEEDTVEVLTTFGKAELENLQDSTAASQSSDRVNKYKTNAWDALGSGEILFNPTNSTALNHQIKKDEAFMRGFLNIYQTWIKFHVDKRFSRKGLDFDFQILDITKYNKTDVVSDLFRGAQYGYSKMAAGIAIGIKQLDQISLMTFENDFLKMSEKMVPLQSSYTTSGNVVASEEKNNSSTQKESKNVGVPDLDNKGGRPALPDSQKSEKTQANIEAAS